MGAAYDYIATKIKSLKDNYPSLRSKPDDYVFSALCVEVNFFHKTISQETVLNAMLKMARFYHDMKAGHYERVNAQVQTRTCPTPPTEFPSRTTHGRFVSRSRLWQRDIGKAT